MRADDDDGFDSSLSIQAKEIACAVGQCVNLTLDEYREQSLDRDGDWDCAGLAVQSGDQVSVIVTGEAE
ncbi:MAG: hypothetical protein AAFX85_14500 [Pseudomonadota bacterium]